MPAKRLDAMLAMTRLLAKPSASFERIVRRAFESPDDVADDFGMDAGDKLLPWIALVSALEDRDQIAAVDSSEDAEELIANIAWRGSRRVRKDRARWAWSESLALHEIAASDLLPRVAGELAEKSLAVASLDVEDDSFYLILLDDNAAARLVQHAKAAGLGRHVQLVRGKKPKAPKRAPWTNLELEAAGSNKFWGIRIRGRTIETTWGRIGTAGQRKLQSCATQDAAVTLTDRLIAEKLRKGYARATWRPPAFTGAGKT